MLKEVVMHFQEDRICRIGEQPRKGNQLVKILSHSMRLYIVGKVSSICNRRILVKTLDYSLSAMKYYTKGNFWRQKETNSLRGEIPISNLYR